jgi:hypothetical protein
MRQEMGRATKGIQMLEYDAFLLVSIAAGILTGLLVGMLLTSMIAKNGGIIAFLGAICISLTILIPCVALNHAWAAEQITVALMLCWFCLAGSIATFGYAIKNG